MEGNELRIENYFHDKDRNIEVASNVIDEGDFVIVNHTFTESLQPINLNEKWLQSFDFTQNNEDEYANVVIFKKSNGKFFEKFYGTEIQYIHQL